MTEREKRHKKREERELDPGQAEIPGKTASTENQMDPLLQDVRLEDMGTVRLDRILEIRSALRTGAYNEETLLADLFRAFEDEVAGMFEPGDGLGSLER